MIENVYDKYYTEESFSVSVREPIQITFRSLNQYIALIVGYWFVFLFPTIICLMVSEWRWGELATWEQYLIAGLGLMALHVNVKFMPRYVIITSGSRTFDYYWGIYPVTLHYVLSTDKIKGICVSTQKYGKGSLVPHLALALDGISKGFLFARYPENNLAMDRAHYLSKLTGVPVLIVGLKEVFRRRNL